MSRRTLMDYFEYFRRYAGDIAYVHRRGYRAARWRYQDVLDAASRFSRELDHRGIRRGERVLLWGENCAEWIAAFLGCAMRGVVVVPMDRIASPDFAVRVGQQVDARLMIVTRENERLSSGFPAMLLEDIPGLAASRSPEPFIDEGVGPEDPLEIVFTSGTTADPKGVVISHRNVLANLAPFETEIAKYLSYERFVHPLRFLNLLPLSHVFGQFLGIFIPQLLGGTVLFQDSLNPTEVIRTIKAERVSVLVGVPRILETLRDKIERDYELAGRLDWFREQFADAEGEHFIRRWWRFREIHGNLGWKFWALISGGAALDAETETFWGRLSFVVIQGYGLTETTSLVSVNHPFKRGKGSIGKVLPGREIKLAENGEILVRGESIASGYWQGREMKPVIGEENWFHTGDVGEIDSEGMLYFKGRKKDVIVTPEGMNVYPEDLEQALRRQPGVRDCVVVGLQREGNAEPCAVLILRDPAEDGGVSIRAANESLAEYQKIRRWLVWPEEDFPRTSTQKPRTSVILEYAGTQFRGDGCSPAPPGTLAELLRRITGSDRLELRPDSNLSKDLNLSSIDRVELLSALEDRYQVDLNESRFSAATTVADLERMLREPGTRRSDYRYPRWVQRWPITWIRIAVYYLLSYPATLLMARPEIRGQGNLKGVDGPLLVVSNHVTQIDIGYVMIALPLRLRHRLAVAMWGEMLQRMRFPTADMSRWDRWRSRLNHFLVVTLFNVFPLPQDTGFRESFAYAGESADRGYSIVVFPEGRRTHDGKLSPFRAGIGMLAMKLDLPVLPVRIDGLFELKKARKKLAAPGTVKVTIGEPVRYDPNAEPEEIARDLEDRMRRLEFRKADG